MLVFDKNNFNDEDVNYLNFSDEFEIELNKGKIKTILGPNGIGKTSIFRDIMIKHPEYAYIDYGDIKNSVSKKGNNILIAPSIEIINSKNAELNKIMESLNTKTAMRNLGITNREGSNLISKDLNTYRSDTKKAIDRYNGEKVDIIIGMDGKYKSIIQNYGQKVFDTINQEIELQQIKDNYKKMFLQIIEEYIKDDEHECPVCGTVCEKTIKEIIKEKIENLKEIEDEILRDYIYKNPDVSPEQVVKDLGVLKQIIKENNITINDVEDYFICGGNKDKSKLIIDSKDVIARIEKELSDLESKKDSFYNNIIEIKERIIELFKNTLKVPTGDINFNDELKQLEIKMPLKIEKYSTGEINLITFMVSLLEFLSSDKNTIIIDDPLSSYDIPNQYKIIYEITAANNDNNYILMFTHNIDCLNIANSQNKGAYEFEIVDSVDKTLYLNSLNLSRNDGLNIKYILEKIDNAYPYKEYIELLEDKDNWEEDAEEHNLFHYDKPYTYPSKNCTNDELVNMIDNFTTDSINNENAIINSANKIIYLAATRVWVEYQFYHNNNDSIGLSQQEQLGNKIKFMFDGNHWTGSSKVTKAFLMSKKVMLNQHEHSNSQKEPFYYALSLSMDNIIDEILDIKEHFEN